VGKFCSLRYLHDYDYIFRMMLANPGRVHYLEDEKLLYYRIHAGNTLGEAAIAGRLQDQELIRRYLLEVIPAAQRGYVAAGTDRLVELERELQAVRAALQPNGEQGVRPAVRQLARSLKTWLRKRLA